MKRIAILVAALVMVMISTGFAQQNADWIWYDGFSNQWLNFDKWYAGPICAGMSYDCVREIQNGKLRLEIRDFGSTGSDSGQSFSSSDLWFHNPNPITGIASDVILTKFGGKACSTNSDATVTIVKPGGGTYFNTGTGDPADDVGDDLQLLVFTGNPKTIVVSNQLWTNGYSWSMSTLIGYYPIGTPLTVSNRWDKANHRFISIVQVTGDASTRKSVVVPYTFSDALPPVDGPTKFLNAAVWSANCTSAQTFAQVEAFFDNVKIQTVP